jgi:hypothetical protein
MNRICVLAIMASSSSLSCRRAAEYLGCIWCFDMFFPYVSAPFEFPHSAQVSQVVRDLVIVDSVESAADPLPNPSW